MHEATEWIRIKAIPLPWFTKCLKSYFPKANTQNSIIIRYDYKHQIQNAFKKLLKGSTNTLCSFHISAAEYCKNIAHWKCSECMGNKHCNQQHKTGNDHQAHMCPKSDLQRKWKIRESHPSNHAKYVWEKKKRFAFLIYCGHLGLYFLWHGQK